MIRVVIFFVALALVALGIGWIADRPGEVGITWQGWRIETSVMVLIVATTTIVAVMLFLWSFLRAIFSSPGRVSSLWHQRRGRQGYLAISKGLIAIGLGDARAARKYAGDANRLAPNEPLALLLDAQSAQLSGDRAGAERSFRAMALREDTKLLGLRGLYIEAQRREDVAAARLYSEEAAKTAPSLAWAGQAVLQLRCAAGDWAGALDSLDSNWRGGAFDKSAYHRQRAVLMTALAQTLEETDRDRAHALILEAASLAPDLVPAAALAGRFLAEAGELRKSSRMIEKAWRANPHPDLADAYAHLRFGDSARDRLARMRKLAELMPGHIESALALARAAIDAGEFATARASLAPFLVAPPRRVAMMMSELEGAEHGDEGRAREWMSRALNAARDPVWTADGFVSDQWMPMSPVSGRIDAFEWKVPLAEIAAERSLADKEEEESAVMAAGPAYLEPPAAKPVKAESADAVDSTPVPAPQFKDAALRPARAPVAETVIPLVHVPDDPGPDHELEPEPVLEASIASGWRRLFFK